MTECQCEQAGWCERHKMHKSEAWWRLCRNKAVYRDAWDKGEGPGQLKVEEGRVPRRRRPAVGTELRKIMGWMCGAFPHTNELNRWGPEVCSQKMETIVAWMVEHGRKSRAPIEAESARRLIVLAIERAITVSMTRG